MLNDIQVFDLTLPAIKKSAKLSALLDSKGLNIGKMDILENYRFVKDVTPTPKSVKKYRLTEEFVELILKS